MKPNIILITIDSLRADRLSSLGYYRQLTPNLEKIAEKGCLFTQAISVGGNTILSFPGIFASMYPFVFLQANDKGYLRIPEGVRLITEILKEKGYNTIAFNSNPLLTYYRHYDKGFDLCEGLFEKRKFKMVKKGLSFVGRRVLGIPILPYPLPEQVNKRVISLLNQDKRRPFFLWVHHLNVHTPYMPPKRFQQEVSGEVINCKEMLYLDRKRLKPSEVTEKDLQKLINLYDAGIKYADYSIGELLKELSYIGVDFNNTLFIITSDHGDEFREHGRFTHSAKLYDELIRVPLIIAGPKLKPRVIKEQFSLLSIPPTILSFVSKENNEFFLGKNMYSLLLDEAGGEEYVISEGCQKNVSSESPRAINERISCRSLFWKYIYNYDGQDELYSLTQDPGETINLVNDERKIAENFKQKILEHLEREKILVRRLKETHRIKTIIKSKGL